MRRTLLLSFIVTLGTASSAQKIPLINSGEVIGKAKAAYDSGHYESAIKHFMTVPDRDTNYVYMQSELALAYIANKENDKAIEVSKQALKKPSSFKAHLYRSYAIALDNHDNFDEAVKIFKEGIEKYPLDYSLYFNLGITYYNHKDYDKAIDCFFKVLSINPFHAGSHINLGKLAMGQGKKTHAMLSMGMYFCLNNMDHDRLVWLEKFLTNQYPDESTLTFEAFNQFDRLDQIIKSKVALNKDYKTHVPINAAIVRQYQLLFEQLQAIQINTNDRWASYYIPIYQALANANLLEPFTYHILTSIDNAQVQKWLKKNEKTSQRFYEATNASLKNIRATLVVPEFGFSKPVAAEYFDNHMLESLGNKDAGENPTGHWIYFYTNGERSAEGNYSDAGEKRGEWKYFYDTGLLHSIENYESGEMKMFYSDGILEQKFITKNDTITGEASVYYSCGALKDALVFSKNKRHGTCKSFYASGKLYSTYNYVNGKLHGECVIYHENGNIESKMLYEDDKLQGAYQDSFPNGKVKTSGEYAGNKMTGTWQYFHSNGKLHYTGRYVDGIAVGEWQYYNVRGELIEKRNFNEKGELDGETAFYEHNKLYSTYQHKNDRVIKISYFDENGKPLGTFGNPGGTFPFKQYYSNGQLSGEGTYKNGKLHGSFKYYFHNGKVINEYTYVAGKLDGPSTEYFRTGKKKYVFNYKDDHIDGYFQEFYNNGQLKGEGWFQDGKRQQQWKYYHPNGKLQSDYYYLNNEVTGLAYDYNIEGKLYLAYDYADGRIADMKDYNSKGEIKTNKLGDRIKSVYESRYSNGKLAEHTELNCGHYTGTYTRWFPDGKVFYSYNFLNGEKYGPYEYHSITNHVLLKGEFVDGKETGLWKGYFDSGRPEHEGWYLDGESDSTWTFFYPNGNISSKIEYLGDKRNGLTQNFSPEGTVVVEKLYHNGEVIAYRTRMPDGKFSDWNPFKGNETIVARNNNGLAVYEENYKDGLLDGVFRIYYANGQLCSESHFVAGDYDGPSVVYYPNGKIGEKANYKDDEIDGIKTHYNEDGSLHKTENFIFGSRHGKSTLYQNGVKIKEYNFSGALIEE